MTLPVIRPFRSALDPFSLYRNLASVSEVSFFLDSPARGPNQRYSYLGAGPEVEIVMKQNRIFLTGPGLRRTLPASRLFPCLRGLLQGRLTSGETPLGKTRMPSFQRKPGPGFFTGGLVGYWGYELAEHFEKIRFRRRAPPALPRLHLGLYREVILYDHRRDRYFLAVYPARGESRAAVERRFQRLQSWFERPGERPGEKFRLGKFKPEMSRRRFERMVRRAKEYIAAGDIYQANLSQRFLFKYRGDPLAIYRRLRSINPSPFASFLQFRDLSIVSSSPERLIRKSGTLCETRPIAGTRPVKAGAPGGRAVARELLTNTKERAEHLMLVDLERNDLGRVCGYRTVKVGEMMTTERYSHVMHIVSEVTGRLQKGKDGLDLIRAMFPGGTVTGCPKIRCMQIIDELEPSCRGIYTGSIGHLDFRGDLDLNIVIRTLVLRRGRGVLQTGAGIVHDSDPSREYDETLHKAEALVEALASASAP